MPEEEKVPARAKLNRRLRLTVQGLTLASLCICPTALYRAHLIGYDLESDALCTDSPVATQLPAWSGKIQLRVAFQAQRAVENASSDDNQQPRDLSQRQPERMIRDPDAAYSAVAVDTSHNEVVLTDENRFNVLIYDRNTNTRPTSVSDPKRIIGGLNTRIEFQCGLYIDPVNGDIYAVNNDTVDTLVIFSRQAVGDVKPDRELHTPHGTFGIAVDEAKQELFLTVQHDNAIVVYNKSAKGAEAPLRVIQGDDTGLADPHGMTLDSKRGLLYVTNYGSTHSVRESEPRAGRKREETPGFPLSPDNAVPGSGKFGQPSITVYAKDATGN